MSIEALNWALGHMQREEIESSTAFVLMILANRADPEGVCWPSVRYIMARTKLADSTVRAACKKIAALGLLGVEEQKRQDGGKGTNRYFLRLDVPPPPTIGGGHPQQAAGAPPTIGGQETKEETPLPDGKGARTRTGAKKFPIPDDFRLDEELLKWTAEHGLPRDYVDQQFEAFGDDARSNRRIHADWPAAFRNWLRRQPNFDKTAQRPVRGARAPEPARPPVENRCAWTNRGTESRCGATADLVLMPGGGAKLCPTHERAFYDREKREREEAAAKARAAREARERAEQERREGHPA